MRGALAWARLPSTHQRVCTPLLAFNVAVMGCIVDGPGESKHADIGISLPGTGETPAAPVFIDGKKAITLPGATVAADFKKLVIDYIEKRYGAGAGPRAAAE